MAVVVVVIGYHCVSDNIVACTQALGFIIIGVVQQRIINIIIHCRQALSFIVSAVVHERIIIVIDN